MSADFMASPEEFALIATIAARYEALCVKHGRKELAVRTSLLMDIEAAHCNGNPLRLDELLVAPDGGFLHDIDGIIINLNRESGKLGNHFLPRYSAHG